MTYKILFSNIGYARGIDGTLWQHVMYMHRHFYCNISVQQQALLQLKEIITLEKPDLCCFVEVDNGSFHSSYYNQMKFLMDDDYMFQDVANKYGEENWLSDMPLFKGKSNGFLARHDVSFERLYFQYGSKRLVYKILLPGNILVFFTHFSLQKKTRVQQFNEIKNIIKNHDGEIIILADFNIMQGFIELEPLLQDTKLKLLNTDKEFTFTFHRTQRVLDLCICSETLAKRLTLRVIPQPFSDHAALLVEGDFLC